MSEISETEIKSMTKEQNYIRGYKDGYAHGYKNGKSDVLDKIRVEVEQMDFDFGDFYDNTDAIIEMVCKVIDKYTEKIDPRESEG